MSDGPWFYCLKHGTVEPLEGCVARDRLGPFATRAEAERALQTIAERNERADAADKEWEEGRR